MKKELIQIIDANFNRLREGLRVCEDITRFVLADKKLTICLKLIRHRATNAIVNSKNLSFTTLLQSRDIKKDPAKYMDYKMRHSADFNDIFMSNIERSKESLRVLEECSKIINSHLSPKFRKLRFDVYDAEKRFIKKTRRISDSR